MRDFEYMPTIIYVEFDGTEHQVDVPLGFSVMEGAVKNGLPGIEADCGGACACATCHVLIGQEWAVKLGGPSVMEESMLEFAIGATGESRLSCQIEVSDALDGLVVRMPEHQR